MAPTLGDLLQRCLCPAARASLFSIEPLSRRASEKETKVHDTRSAELLRYKLGKTSAQDADAYHRVGCPAVLGKLRCPAREASMALSFPPICHRVVSKRP
jgi:hypothetical protein